MELKEQKEYHENGQLWVHCFYQNDKIHGEYKAYYENGQLEICFFYLDDNEMNVPVIKQKPARKEYKSQRTRYQTLEIS